MNELTGPITDLKGKVEKLVALHQTLKKECEEIKEEKEALQKTINEQQETIATLEKNNNDLVDNKEEEENNMVSDTKLKINELVQEIDNCIALLK